MIFIILLVSILSPSIADVPLNFPETTESYGESHLIATLTNRLTGHVLYMEEYISTKENRKGKIVVTGDIQSYTIFYDERDDFRSVMTDTDCQMFKYYNQKWTQLLPNVADELENTLILFGPSIYYRIQSLLINPDGTSKPVTWFEGNPAILRGIQVESKYAKLDETLNVTVYQQGLYSYDDPHRVDFIGYLKEMSSSSSFLTIDFYLIEYLRDLKYDVAPTPGIGCAQYPVEDKDFPSDQSIGITDAFHFSAVEFQYQGSPTAGTEMVAAQISLELFVDVSAQIVRYIVDYGGTLLETIYDYNLGISYSFEEPKCMITPMTGDDIGVIDGKFDVKELLWQKGNFKYLGKVQYEQRNGVISNVWEKVDYDSYYSGTKYAKIVTTQYFADKIDIAFPIPNSDEQILIGMTKKYYSLDAQKNYRLEETSRRDVYDFYKTISESEYQTLFQVSDCDNEEKDKLYLIFQINPANYDQSKTAIETAEQNLITLRKSIRDLISQSIQLSPLRISNIDFDFSQESIAAHVMFIQKSEFTDGLIKQIKQIDKSSINPYPNSFDSLSQCANTVAYSKQANSLAWCKDSSGQLCAPVKDVSSLTTDHGSNSISCEIYTHAVGSLLDLIQETDLSNVHDYLLDKAIDKPFLVGPSDNESRLFKFVIVNIIYSDVTEDVKSSKLLFSQLFSSYKLKSDNPRVYTPEQSISTLGDCYHICESSEVIDCTSFSFCINSKDKSKVSCQLTSQVFLVEDDEGTRDAIEADSNCNLYTKNHILDFVKISGRKLTSTGIKELVLSADQCAAKCAALPGCNSFDYCDKSACALSDEVYLDKLSTPDSNCDSYMLKKTESFKITGNQLTTDVMFTEEGVNLDQCAALCFDFVSGDDKCQSFNYCPKGLAQSTCQLSQKLVSKSDQITTASGGNCFNYELISTDKNDDKSTEVIVTSAGGGILAIVMVICLIVGFIYGFVGEFVYLKFNNQLRTRGSSNFHSTTVSWSRQLDDSPT